MMESIRKISKNWKMNGEAKGIDGIEKVWLMKTGTTEKKMGRVIQLQKPIVM